MDIKERGMALNNTLVSFNKSKTLYVGICEIAEILVIAILSDVGIIFIGALFLLIFIYRYFVVIQDSKHGINWESFLYLGSGLYLGGILSSVLYQSTSFFYLFLGLCAALLGIIVSSDIEINLNKANLDKNSGDLFIGILCGFYSVLTLQNLLSI